MNEIHSTAAADPHAGRQQPAHSRVYLETGKTWVFACALDWPGWCRRGRGEHAALDALLDYSERYAVVAGPEFDPGSLKVIGRVSGNKTTDFGAPDARGPWDDEHICAGELHRQIELLRAAWQHLDRVISQAPASLRKGPRGGGRDRDDIALHVREAERAYAAKAGLRIPPRTPWPEQRTSLAQTLEQGAPDVKWPVRYTIRRCAWHILDHAWEIEDKSI